MGRVSDLEFRADWRGSKRLGFAGSRAGNRLLSVITSRHAFVSDVTRLRFAYLLGGGLDNRPQRSKLGSGWGGEECCHTNVFFTYDIYDQCFRMQSVGMMRQSRVVTCECPCCCSGVAR